MNHSSIHPDDRIAGKYRIIRTLGRGGMGVVYLAHHELLDRLVALKVLHSQAEQPSGATARFEREIKAMALVRNPHIAHALDADALPNGSLYLVMEYLDGRNLRAELKLRRAIPYPEAVAYVIQACVGVAAVHDVGIIHRDLKPHNLFLTQLNAARCLKVLDFGIAKFVGGADATLTATDVAVGTPLYMSPEQLTSPNKVSPRSDVWALGVVLYELIAGVSPFAASSPGAVVAAVVLEKPALLSDFIAVVPQPLAQTIADALIKSPEMRISGVRELAERLAPFSMPTDAILVASATSSQRPVVALERASVRPELYARIKSEVDAFDENLPFGDRGTQLDALRHLPSLAKLALHQASTASPLARRTPPAQLEETTSSAPTTTVIVTTPSSNPVQTAIPQLAASIVPGLPIATDHSRARHSWRLPLGTIGILVVISGVLVAVVTLRSHTTNSPQQVPVAPSRQTAVASPTPPQIPENSPKAATPTSGAAASDLASARRLVRSIEVPAASATPTASSSRTTPSRRPPTAPNLPPPIPTVGDSNPLHL